MKHAVLTRSNSTAPQLINLFFAVAYWVSYVWWWITDLYTLLFIKRQDFFYIYLLRVFFSKLWNVQFLCLHLQFFYQILCYFYSRISSLAASKQYERALFECPTFMSACHFIRIRQYPPEIIIPYRFSKWRRWSRQFRVDVTHLRKLKSICKPVISTRYANPRQM